MQRNKYLMQRLADAADLGGETLPGVPVIEIAGDRRVIIEGHRGVIAYSRTKICVRLPYGNGSVCGQDLELTCMTRDQLVISGRIDCVQLERRNG